jgi:hypothetical protein
MFVEMDSFRDENIIGHLMWLWAADRRGRLNHENEEFGDLFTILYYHSAAKSVKFSDLEFKTTTPTPTQIHSAFQKARMNEINKWKK